MKKDSEILTDYLNPKDYFIICLFLSLIFHAFFSVLSLIRPPLSYVGAILVVAGISINLWADYLIREKEEERKIWQHGGVSAMVTSGPYQYSRHPVYLGYFLILFGLSVFLGSIVALVFPAIFLLMMELIYVPIEEEALEEEFGEEYREYKKNIRRWL